MAFIDTITNIESAITSRGPASVLVMSDPGQDGTRGSYIIPYYGRPDLVSFPITIRGDVLSPQLFDWYININPDDTEYMYIYQYKSSSSGNYWDPIFKLIPNTYSKKKTVTFTGGSATINLSIPKKSIPFEQKMGSSSIIPSTATTVANEAAMLASSTTTGHYVYRADKNQFFLLEGSSASSLSNWTPGVSINLQLDVESTMPTPKAQVTNFTMTKPTISSGVFGLEVLDTYEFSITVNTKELGSTLPHTFTDISGSRLVHLTLSVV